MKKNLLLALCAVCCVSVCFAETRVIEEDKEERSSVSNLGLSLDLGTPLYFTNRLATEDNLYSDAKAIMSNGIMFELGTFDSDEDGLFDFVEKNTFGYQHGVLNTYNNFKFRCDTGNWYADDDAQYNNFYAKSLAGIQLNTLFLSFGGMFGLKTGFDWLRMPVAGTYRDSDYRENRIFIDFALQPYLSVNLFRFVKISLSAEFDLPITRFRFIKEPNSGAYYFHWDWFKDDIPVSYMAGATLFF